MGRPLQAPRRKPGGFTLIEILIVVAVLGLLVAIAVPNFMRTRVTAQTKTCMTNLSKIDAAKQLWGLEYGKTSADTPLEADLVPSFLQRVPLCPAGGTYDYRPIGQPPTCTVAGHTL